MITVEIYDDVENCELNQEELLSYLTEGILLRLDETIEEKNNLLNKTRKVLKKSKEKFSSLKEKFESSNKKLSREKALSRVLNLIETLYKEGLLIGQNRKKIIDVLDNISNYDFDKLRNIEEKLYSYLPDRLVGKI